MNHRFCVRTLIAMAVCIVGIGMSIPLTSCSTMPSQHIINNIESEAKKAQFAAAYALLESEKSSLYGKMDSVLYFIDSGLLSYFAKDFPNSNIHFSKAEQRIYENFTKSIAEGVGSFLVNDTVMEYAGEDYEDIYTNIFMSLNYYHLGLIDDAFVELRRVDNKLKVLKSKYVSYVEAGKKKAENDYDSTIPYNAQITATQFYNSALARYISMLFYRHIGKYDAAKIDQKFIYEAFSAQEKLYAFPVPKSISEELSISDDKARLNLIAFTGLAPSKIEEITRITLSEKGYYYKLSLPVMLERPSQIASIQLVFEDGTRYPFEMLEDISKIAIDTFKERQGIIYVRTLIRSITKSTSTAVMSGMSQQSENEGDSLLFDLLAMGSQLFTELSEQADLRTTRFFPSKAHIAGVTLDPGTYNFAVEYYNIAGKIIYTDYFDNVTLTPQELYLQESVCLQ